MLASHALVACHLFAQLVGVIVLSLLLRHNRCRTNRREVIVRPVVASSRMLQQSTHHVTIETALRHPNITGVSQLLQCSVPLPVRLEYIQITLKKPLFYNHQIPN